MDKSNRRKKASAIFVFLAATAIPSHAQTFTTLVNFTMNNAQPNQNAPLIQGTDGNLYGTTAGSPGVYGGTVFKVTLGGTLTTLSSLPFVYDYDPNGLLGGVIQGTDGNFYGTSYYGGGTTIADEPVDFGGTIFKVTPSGTFTALCSFVATTTYPYSPEGGLVQGTDGNLYGTSPPSPGADNGAVFGCTPGGTLTTLAGANFGAAGRLVQATDGNLYGLTADGGPKGYGTVFKISPAGTLTAVYSFGSASSDGRIPSGWLVQASDGDLYGVTTGGGTGNSGTFFKVTLEGTLTTLHSFVSKTDGRAPTVGLIQATDGNFYGTTNQGQGGAFNGGTIFKVTTTGTLTTLYSFTETSGGISNAGVLQASDGKLYGTTQQDGAYGAGTIFSLTLPAAPPAAPVITSGGIVPVYSSSSTIQPGEWVSIYGANLASSTATWTGNFPTSLGGTSITINGKSGYLWFVSPTQINVQAPSDTATGTVPVVVTTAGGSQSSTITLAPFAPSFSLLDATHVTGIILRPNGSGAYGGGSYDIIGPTGTSLGYPTVAAKAGDTVELFGVGFGPTNPPVPAGQIFSGSAATTNAVGLLINTVSVAPSFAGLSSAGLYQLNLTVPSGLGTGDVSLVGTVGGVQTQAGVVISLQ